MNGAIEDTGTTEGGTLAEIVELPPVELGPADTVIAGLRKRLEGQKADSSSGYKIVVAGIRETRTHRTDVDRGRKQLIKSAQGWIREVNGEARRVTGLLLDIESPLKQEKLRIDYRNEQIKKEEDKKIRLAQDAKERAEREAREKEKAAERERVRLQQEAERKRLEAERADLEKQRAAQTTRHRAEQEILNAERRELEQDRKNLKREQQKTAEEVRKKLEAEEATRQKQRAEQVAREKAEQAKLDAIEQEKQRKEREAEQDRLAEERKPDAEKLRDFAQALLFVECPKLKTGWGRQIHDQARARLQGVTVWIDTEVER